jgi:PAS domain S-box-containing protein
MTPEATLLGRIRNVLPRGRTVPEDALRRRHQGLLALLWLHAAGLTAFSVLHGRDVAGDLAYSAVIVTAAAAAFAARSNLRLSSALVSIGLLTSSALLVRLSGGLIEMHFHFFVVVALLGLYEDWVPFGIAVMYVVVHDGLIGGLDPDHVYNHAAARAHPWSWAAIHGSFIMAAAVGSALAWRLNEGIRVQVNEAHRQIRDSDRRFRAAFDDAPHGMALVSLEPDRLGRFLQVNKAFCDLSGYSEKELLERDFSAITHPDDREWNARSQHRLIAGEITNLEVEKRYVRPDGSLIWVQVNASMVRDSRGKPLYNVAQIQDITARKAHEAEHELLSSIVESSEDAIISKDLEGVVTSWNPGAERLYGFTAEQAIGKNINELIIPEDQGGDERGIINQVLAGEHVLHHETERRHKHGGIIDVSLTASGIRDSKGRLVGISVIGRDISDRKQQELEMRHDVEDYSWARRIRTALEEDRFALFAQPVIDLKSGQATRAEVLLRLRGDRGPNDMISPGEFLGVAERFGLIGEIDRWVLSQVMPLLHGTKAIEVNLSGRSIGDLRLTGYIEKLLEDAHADPSKLTIEITETAATQDMQSARLFAERLQRLGCGLSLDDFGTGYGSFTYLKHVPVQYIKIDMQFIRDLVQSEPDRQVVRSIVGVARDFGVKTIAEGVENAETLELVKAYGIDFAQGYFLGRPEPVSPQSPDAGKSLTRMPASRR